MLKQKKGFNLVKEDMEKALQDYTNQINRIYYVDETAEVTQEQWGYLNQLAGGNRPMDNTIFNKLMDELKQLHSKKNHDYASDDDPYSNFEFAAHLVKEFNNPVDVVFVCMIGIKIARLGQLLSGKTPNNESVEDTLKDLTTYCGIWASYHMSE
jgi:hypothetical protein